MAIKDLTSISHVVFICNGDTCLSKGSDETTNCIRKAIADRALDEKTLTIRTKCMGQCSTGPTVFVLPANTWYRGIVPQLSDELVERHVVRQAVWAEQQLPS
jgi:(2Fe-2S) ferredoxin